MQRAATASWESGPRATRAAGSKARTRASSAVVATMSRVYSVDTEEDRACVEGLMANDPLVGRYRETAVRGGIR